MPFIPSGVHNHLLSTGALEHQHVGGPAGEIELRTGRRGEGQGSRLKGAGPSEIRAGFGRMPDVVNFADLKVQVVIFRVLGDDGDAGDGVAGRVASGGEGLSVISGKAIVGIAA